MRKTEKEVLMENAVSWSRRSYCKRLQVGAVISREGRVVSSGYNGTIKGSENCCETEISNEQGTVLVTRPEVFHAEANAILFAARDGISTKGCEIFITHAPCIDCSKMIVQAGIVKVFYKYNYSKQNGVEFLKKAGITVLKLDD